MNTRSFRRTRLVMLLAVAGIPLSVSAQAQVPLPINSGSVLKDVLPPKGPEPLRPEAPPAPVITQEADTPLTLAEGQTLFIRDFQVDGAAFLDAEQLAAVLAPYRGRELSMNEINEAANRVTVLCRSQGYLVARAYVPKQNIQDGVLLIKVIAGQYGSFLIKNHSLVDDFLLQGTFDASKDDSAIVTRDGLERPMLLVSDMPGARLPTVSIGPGSAPGTSDFVVETEAAERLAGYLVADNYGSRFTGKNRLSFGADLNSPFGIADRLSISGLTSQGGGLQNGRAVYAFPLSYNGLRGEIAAGKTTYKLGDEYADLDATGVADVFEGTLSYPLRRSREDNIYLSLNFAGKRLKDEIAATSTTIAKRAKVATLTLQRETYGSLFGYSTYLNLSGALTVGRLEFDDDAQKAANKAGADTAGNYGKLNFTVTGNLAFDNTWSLGGSVRLQQALNKNLDGSEQLSISGPNGIRSYPDGVTGDNGYLVNLEVKYALPAVIGIEHAVSVFADYGAGRPEDGGYTTVGWVSISDAGVAYTAADKTFFGRLQLAQTLGEHHEISSYNNKFKVQAQIGLRF